MGEGLLEPKQGPSSDEVPGKPASPPPVCPRRNEERIITVHRLLNLWSNAS
ncbi:hypothetical protein PHLCEN_2v13472 [Hermanssonia centrifuga]|uniref:Uncharacterized protein n=1 Tax=Hermanssonia centrifuga TaxID=98765 RepID=A0A2R6NE60_9APHY|nr:hypothetical protein PHLCEN_2v13472 [Hermanssonia centrifuga]